jgi:hypothetical protein
MSYRTVIFIAAAAICTVMSGITQAAPIRPLPAGVVTDTGNATQIYYYRYHYRYHRYARYHHYRYY